MEYSHTIPLHTLGNVKIRNSCSNIVSQLPIDNVYNISLEHSLGANSSLSPVYPCIIIVKQSQTSNRLDTVLSTTSPSLVHHDVTYCTLMKCYNLHQAYI